MDRLSPPPVTPEEIDGDIWQKKPEFEHDFNYTIKVIEHKRFVYHSREDEAYKAVRQSFKDLQRSYLREVSPRKAQKNTGQGEDQPMDKVQSKQRLALKLHNSRLPSSGSDEQMDLDLDDTGSTDMDIDDDA